MIFIIFSFDETKIQFYKISIFVALYLKEFYESKGSF